jgi:hypothetical protein
MGAIEFEQLRHAGRLALETPQIVFRIESYCGHSTLTGRQIDRKSEAIAQRLRPRIGVGHVRPSGLRDDNDWAPIELRSDTLSRSPAGVDRRRRHPLHPSERRRRSI